MEHETTWLLRLKEGCPLAFTQVYRHFAPTMYGKIRALAKDESLAEEAVQQVFTHLWENRYALQVDSSLKGYLVTAARNYLIDHFRKIQREAKLLEAYQRQLDESHRPVDELLAQRDAEDRLRWVLGRLSPQQRRVFQLCKLEGYTYKEAAAQLGISHHTVKEYLADANKTVKDQLAQALNISLPALALFYFF